jgi:ABC-2 type transport system ATP-binding protein
MQARANNPPAGERGPLLVMESVRKRFGKVQAVDGLDLELERGQVTALLGPNGAGKTTAVKLMMGLLRPDQGRVRLFGEDPQTDDNRMRVGAMMQISGVPPTLRVGEHVDLFRSYYPRPLPAAEVIAAAGLDGLERRPYGKLSGGQQQRLMFALAICGDPDLLFLDEPTVGLDVESRHAFWEQIRGAVDRGRTVLLTTHYLEEADALADRVVVIDQGRAVADDTPEQIKRRAAARKIRCRTSLGLEELRALPGVRQARKDKGFVELRTGEAEPVVRLLLERDPALADLEVTGAGLEEAFLSLVGRSGPPQDTAPSGRRKGAA